jgi:hypothetical protein
MNLLTGGCAAANLVHGREAVRSDILAMGDWVRDCNAEASGEAIHDRDRRRDALRAQVLSVSGGIHG